MLYVLSALHLEEGSLYVIYLYAIQYIDFDGENVLVVVRWCGGAWCGVVWCGGVAGGVEVAGAY